jgi:hypothetical protein
VCSLPYRMESRCLRRRFLTVLTESLPHPGVRNRRRGQVRGRADSGPAGRGKRPGSASAHRCYRPPLGSYARLHLPTAGSSAAVSPGSTAKRKDPGRACWAGPSLSPASGPPLSQSLRLPPSFKGTTLDRAGGDHGAVFDRLAEALDGYLAKKHGKLRCDPGGASCRSRCGGRSPRQRGIIGAESGALLFQERRARPNTGADLGRLAVGEATTSREPAPADPLRVQSSGEGAPRGCALERDDPWPEGAVACPEEPPSSCGLGLEQDAQREVERTAGRDQPSGLGEIDLRAGEDRRRSKIETKSDELVESPTKHAVLFRRDAIRLREQLMQDDHTPKIGQWQPRLNRPDGPFVPGY